MPQATRKFNFTDARLRDEPTPKHRMTILDSKTDGLGVLLQPTGHRSFFWLRRVAGEPMRKQIGACDALSVGYAREKASGWNTELERWRGEGFDHHKNPFKEQRDAVTFGQLFNAYHTQYRKENAKNAERALPEERSMFDRYLKRFETRKMDSLQHEEVRALHSEIMEAVNAKGKFKGRVIASRVVQLGRRVVNWACGQEVKKWKGDNPFKIRLQKEKSRDRFAQPDELKRLFAALATEQNPDVRDFVLLALYTGQRRSNITAMRWSELSLTADGQHLWTIPAPKNNQPQVVPLMPQAVAVLKRRNAHAGSPFVFPSEAKRGHIPGITRGWYRVRAEAKLDNLTIHDLRRTLGSWMATSGVSLVVIGEALGHKSLDATRIYARLQTHAVKDAMALATAKFPKMLSGVVIKPATRRK